MISNWRRRRSQHLNRVRFWCAISGSPLIHPARLDDKGHVHSDDPPWRCHARGKCWPSNPIKAFKLQTRRVRSGRFRLAGYIATDGAGFIPMRSLPPGVPPNLALSLFGITGPTAYFGVLDVGQAKAGETFVVSGAAGATGSVAGQIAKIKGCRVIGTAGGKAKCDWLKNELGFDGVIDYQSEDVGAQLSPFAPMGSTCFSTMSVGLSSMRFLPVCG